MLQSKDRVAVWAKNQQSTIFCLPEACFRAKDLNTLKVRGWKKYFMQMEMTKKSRVVIFTSDKTDYKIKYTKIKKNTT